MVLIWQNKELQGAIFWLEQHEFVKFIKLRSNSRYREADNLMQFNKWIIFVCSIDEI